MAQRFSFGAYIPGHSYVHKVSAQVKIILACAFSISVFFIGTWMGLAVIAVALAALYGVSGISLLHGLRGVGPVAFVLLFTVFVHALSFTMAGLLSGLFIATRIALLIMACMLLTFTTSATELTSGLVSLLGPLRRLRFPADDLALVVSLALRFIPITSDEAYAVRNAQMARCGDFESGSIIVRAKAWGPVLVPLFVRLFRRAEDLARAMDARCYKDASRVHAYGRRVTGKDVALLLASLAVLVALCWFL